jgi:hypothetical protein
MEVMGDPGDERSAKELAAQTEAQSVGQAMRMISGPLLRQIRRFQALDACLKALSPKLMGLCAPFDYKITQSPSSEDSVATVYWYIASATVETALESKKRQMLQEINAGSAQLVEEFRYELAGAERIREQLNILSARPD